jgi:hypothetical protein
VDRHLVTPGDLARPVTPLVLPHAGIMRRYPGPPEPKGPPPVVDKLKHALHASVALVGLSLGFTLFDKTL